MFLRTSTLLFEETLRHPTEEIAKYASVIDQKDFRKAIILDFLKEKNCAPESLNVIVGRGGLLKPIPGGTYPVSDALLADLKAGVQGQHASNLGGILAREIGDSLGIPSYIVDPVVVDELTNKARISGMPELPRRSIFHWRPEPEGRGPPLCQGERQALRGSEPYRHPHGRRRFRRRPQPRQGRLMSTTFWTAKAASAPSAAAPCPLATWSRCASAASTPSRKFTRRSVATGGFNGYLHTNDARTVGKMADEGNAEAKLVWDAFFYQIAKDAGAMAAVLHGQVDQIILTGGIAYNPNTEKYLKEYLGFIAPITVYPGEDELLALCQGALRVMTGEEKPMAY